MKSKICLQLVATILSFTAINWATEEQSKLFSTKWQLDGFFNAESNELKKPDSSDEDRYTLEFSRDSTVSYEDRKYWVCKGRLAHLTFWGFYSADYARSTIDFEVIIRSATTADSEDGEKFDRALYLSRGFELKDADFKMYYGNKGDYLLFNPWGQSGIPEGADIATPANMAKSVAVAPEFELTNVSTTAGPNPVARSAGIVNFYRVGDPISHGKLKVFDVSGKLVRKLRISDNATLDNRSHRQVGSWDLRDAKGRLVSEGTYLVRGTVKTSDGKSERVSLGLGVR
jgi:hypothetical protein